MPVTQPKPIPGRDGETIDVFPASAIATPEFLAFLRSRVPLLDQHHLPDAVLSAFLFQLEQRRPLAAHEALVRLAHLSLPNARRVYHACDPYIQAWLLPGSPC
jgi:hypothetical protein